MPSAMAVSSSHRSGARYGPWPLTGHNGFPGHRDVGSHPRQLTAQVQREPRLVVVPVAEMDVHSGAAR